MEHEVLRWAPNGFPLIILEQQNEWSRVLDFRNMEGWVGTRLLVEGGGVILKISRATLHSRPGAGEDEIVAELDYGTILQVVENKGEWIKVATVAGVNGWLHQKSVWP
jgi:SH3-like domain-containing protein